jgi:hypothetical protein
MILGQAYRIRARRPIACDLVFLHCPPCRQGRGAAGLLGITVDDAYSGVGASYVAYDLVARGTERVDNPGKTSVVCDFNHNRAAPVPEGWTFGQRKTPAVRAGVRCSQAFAKITRDCP